MACRDKGHSLRLAGHVLLLKLPFSSRGLRMHHHLPAALSTKPLRRLLLCFFVCLVYILCCSHFAEFCSLFPRVIQQCGHIFDLSLQNTLEGKWPVAQEPARIISHSSISHRCVFTSLLHQPNPLYAFYLPIRFFVASLMGSFRSTSLPGPRMPCSSTVSRMCLTRLVLSDSQCLFLPIEASSSFLLSSLLLLHLLLHPLQGSSLRLA